MSCIRRASVATARSSRFSSFHPIHPVREKRRFVFLRAGLNLIIGKQARFFSSPFSAPLSLSVHQHPADWSRFSHRVFLRRPLALFRPPSPTDVRIPTFGNIEIKLGVPIRLDITKRPAQLKPFAPVNKRGAQFISNIYERLN